MTTAIGLGDDTIVASSSSERYADLVGDRQKMKWADAQSTEGIVDNRVSMRAKHEQMGPASSLEATPSEKTSAAGGALAGEGLLANPVCKFL
jgi:hypothetical protein